MRRIVCAFALLVCASCGDGPTRPSAPPPLPRASIQMDGTPQWAFCAAGFCIFRAEVRNVGPGCGNTVRGVTRFYDASGAAIGAGHNWSLDAGAVIRPNEVVAYSVNTTQGVATATARYLTEPSWTDVRCP